MATTQPQVTSQQINDWFAANSNAGYGQIAETAAQYGVKLEDIQTALGPQNYGHQMHVGLSSAFDQLTPKTPETSAPAQNSYGLINSAYSAPGGSGKVTKADPSFGALYDSGYRLDDSITPGQTTVSKNGTTVGSTANIGDVKQAGDYLSGASTTDFTNPMFNGSNGLLGVNTGKTISDLAGDPNSAFFTGVNDYFTKNVLSADPNADYASWLQSKFYDNNAYLPTLPGVRDAYNAYKNGDYKTEKERDEAYQQVVAAGGNDFDRMYLPYLPNNAVVKRTAAYNEALGGTPSSAPYDPIFNSAVNAPTETIEGRIQNLLAENNPVIRQAGERAMAAFAQRGLLNSSMAIEAANEAMISKAIEIAGPDAERYFQNRRQNVDWNNNFARDEQQQDYKLQTIDAQTEANIREYAGKMGFDLDKQTAEFDDKLRTNYLSAIENLRKDYSSYVTNVNMQPLDLPEKEALIADYENVMRSSINLINSSFSKMPGWESEWTTTFLEDKDAADAEAAANAPVANTDQYIADLESEFGDNPVTSNAIEPAYQRYIEAGKTPAAAYQLARTELLNSINNAW